MIAHYAQSYLTALRSGFPHLAATISALCLRDHGIDLAELHRLRLYRAGIFPGWQRNCGPSGAPSL